MAERGGRLIPITGENMNGFRLGLMNPEFQERGLQGVSAGSPPASAGYAFKLMMEILTGQRELDPVSIEYPLPWVTTETVKLCDGTTIADGCNTFEAGLVPQGFSTVIHDEVFLPEIDLNAALTGEPKAGATIQPLPAEIHVAPPEPGINCGRCEPPADHYKLTVVEPTVQP